MERAACLRSSKCQTQRLQSILLLSPRATKFLSSAASRPSAQGRLDPFAAPRRTTAICAKRPAGIDVERLLRTATVDVAVRRGNQWFGVSRILATFLRRDFRLSDFCHPPEDQGEQAFMIAGRADTRHRRGRTTKSVDSRPPRKRRLHWLCHLLRPPADQGPLFGVVLVRVRSCLGPFRREE